MVNILEAKGYTADEVRRMTDAEIQAAAEDESPGFTDDESVFLNRQTGEINQAKLKHPDNEKLTIKMLRDAGATEVADTPERMKRDRCTRAHPLRRLRYKVNTQQCGQKRSPEPIIKTARMILEAPRIG
jgi:hypothetical protein